MHFLTALYAIAAILPVFAGPASVPVGISIDTHQGEKSGSHIVRLDEGASRAGILAKVNALLAGKARDLGVTHEYDAVFNGFAGTQPCIPLPRIILTVLHGCVGKFDPATLAALQIMPGVKSIEEDGIVRTTAIEAQFVFHFAGWDLR